MSNTRPRRIYTQAKGATNKWDTRQRLVLHILCENFQPSWDIRVKVFNQLFKDHLDACGIPTGVTIKILRAQYGNTERKKPCWAAIMDGPANDEERRQKDALIREIRGIIARLQSTSEPATTLTIGAPRVEVRTPSQPVQSKKRLSEFMHNPYEKRPRPETSYSGTHPSQSDPGPHTGLVTALSPNVPNTNLSTPAYARIVPPVILEAPVTPKSSKFTPDRRSVEETNPRVIIPARSEAAVTPASRRALSKARNQAKKIHEYSRPHGPTLNLSQDAYVKALLPLPEVPEALAHPPTSGLLFRYWDEHTYGKNSETGFTAGRFAYNNVSPRPAPPCTELDWTDLENHLQGTNVASPFCSASNCLIWIMRLALKQRKKGLMEGKITLIKTEALPAKSVFYVKPYQRQLKLKYVFRDGAWNYPGTHEFLIWAKIPQQALIYTFSTADLLAACARMPAMAAALRVETIGTLSRMSLKTTILGQLEEQNLPLSAQTTVVIAKLCRFLGLSASSPLPHLEHVVADFLQGWKFSIQPQSSAEWYQLASLWCYKLCGRESLPSLDRQMALQMCFLQAVKAGLGEWNFMMDTKLINRMQGKAKAVGLESTTRIVLDAMANATAFLLDYETQVDQRYAEAATVRQLPGIEEYFHLESDVPSPSAGPASRRAGAMEDKIMFDDDVLGL